jgi:hypothetical protein
VDHGQVPGLLQRLDLILKPHTIHVLLLSGRVHERNVVFQGVRLGVRILF